MPEIAHGARVALVALALTLPALTLPARTLGKIAAAPALVEGDPPSPAAIPPERTDEAAPVALTFLLTSDLGGAFATLRCEEGAPPVSVLQSQRASYADLVATIVRERARLAAEGAPAPIVLDAGDLLGHASFLRYALFRRDEGVPLLADLVAAAGYDAIALGEDDLTPERPRLLPLVEALAGRGIPFRALNLACDAAKSSLCPYLRVGDEAVVVVERAGVRVAVIPLTLAKLAASVDPVQMEGLTATDPTAAAAAAVQRVRAEGRADVVVLLAHVEDAGTAPTAALRLARAVPGVDVVVANRFARKDAPGGSVSAVVLQGGRPVVLGAPDVPTRLGTFTLHVSRGADPTVTALPAPPIDVPPDLADPGMVTRMEALQIGYCAEWGQPLGHGRVDPPLPAEAFLRFVMEVMRRTHGTDLAFLNRDALDRPDDRPIAGPFTEDELFRLLPYDDRLVVTTLKGEELALLLAAALPPEGLTTGPGLHILGAARDGDAFRVNGRLLETARRYTVVTADFLAAGGRGALGPILELAKWRAATAADDPDGHLRGVVVEFLAHDRQRETDGDDETPDTIAPDTTFRDPWTLPLWTLRADVNGTFAHTGLTNPAGYDEAQLSRQETLSLSTDSRFHLDMGARDHGFANELNLRYGSTSVGGGALSETDDVIRFSSQYRWLWLRNHLGRPRVYMPVPYGRFGLETEFSVPDDRPDRHLEATFEAGVEWLLLDTLSVSVGYGVRHQLIQEDDAHHGLMFRYELQRTELGTLWDAPVTFDSRFELFYSDLGTGDVLKGYGTNRLSLQVFGPLNFTVQHDLFLYGVGSRALGVASDTQIGLQLVLDAYIQAL